MGLRYPLTTCQGRWTKWARTTTAKTWVKIGGKRWTRMTKIRISGNPITMIAMKAQAKAADFSAVFL
jgi:hypothetical protein